MRRCDVLIGGVGGQGNIFAARLIGSAAMEKGMALRGSETIGMAQRGGSVVSHVRIGQPADSPLIDVRQADVIIAMEPGEAIRNVEYLKEDGLIIFSDRPVWPSSGARYDADGAVRWLVRRFGNRAVRINGDEMVDRCGARCLNAALLGAAAAAGAFPFTLEELKKTASGFGSIRMREQNIAALMAGAAAYGRE